jgi:peptidoglycan/xylan/chitin deacetylase (PgdA/CDA1 family)
LSAVLATTLLAILALAAGLAFRTWRVERGAGRAVALLYHRVVSDAENANAPPTERIFSLTEGAFRAQLAYLRERGHRVLSLAELQRHLDARTPLPEGAVVITFDDGCASVHARALPLLQEAGFPAILFVATDPAAGCFAHGESQRRVTDEELRALEAGGVAIGSHGVAHRPLQAMSDAEIRHELADSRAALERALGRAVESFAVPLNWYGRRVRRIAEDVGYRAVMTSEVGSIGADSDRFELRRCLVDGRAGLAGLVQVLTVRGRLERRARQLAKKIPSRIVGPRLWLPLRRRVYASPVGRWLTRRGQAGVAR